VLSATNLSVGGKKIFTSAAVGGIANALVNVLFS
jgi:hypothetical protein